MKVGETDLLPEAAYMACNGIEDIYNLDVRYGKPDEWRAHRPRAHLAGVAQLVEHNVANVVVVGSNPITRSRPICPFSFLRDTVPFDCLLNTVPLMARNVCWL
jgi:hypothetical protein